MLGLVEIAVPSVYEEAEQKQAWHMLWLHS